MTATTGIPRSDVAIGAVGGFRVPSGFAGWETFGALAENSQWGQYLYQHENLQMFKRATLDAE
jgi:hypothetical protein